MREYGSRQRIRKGAMESLENRFVARMRELLVSLPYDMKVLFEAMTDENLPVEARRMAAGAAIYCLSPSDMIPDSMGVLGFVDDVLVVRLGLKRVLKLGGEDAEAYPERFSDQFTRLDEDIDLMGEYLGETLRWLEGRVDTRLVKTRYKGKDATDYVEDDDACEFLYGEGLEFTTDYEIDEEAASRLHSGEAVLELFRKRMADEARRIKS
jgi:uncharacterized membrane protein YkvA (DUF1232 family)